LKGILPVNHSVQNEERLILFQIGLFIWVEETHGSLQTKSSMLEAAERNNYLSVRTELVFERTFSSNHSFQGRERLILFQTGQFN
jgi:hypothetical protein